MGHGQVHFLARFKKGAPEYKNLGKNMSSTKTSTVSSVVGFEVGRYDMSHWKKILASFIANF